MFSDKTFWFSVWKQTLYKLKEYHFITGQLWVMLMIGICLSIVAATSQQSYYGMYNLIDINSTVIFPIIILWLVYISFNLGGKSYKQYDLFLSGTASTSFFSSYFYLIFIAFISAVLTYLAKYPVLLIMFIFSPNEWLVVNEGLTSFITFVSYCFGNYLLFVTVGFMWGILGVKIIAIVAALAIIVNRPLFTVFIIPFIESNVFTFWVGILIICMISSFISYHQYKRLDVK